MTNSLNKLKTKLFFNRMMAIMLSLLLVFSFVPIASALSSGVTVTVGSDEGQRGHTVDVPVYMQGGVMESEIFWAYSIQINYDSRVLEPASPTLITNDAGWKNSSINHTTVSDSVYGVIVSADDEGESDGWIDHEEKRVFTLHFKIKEDAELGDSDVTIHAAYYYSNTEAESFNLMSSGKVTVVEEPNEAPTASGVSIAGDRLIGQTLTGSYTYADAEGDLEMATGSLYQWYAASDEAGSDIAAIDGATDKEFLLTSAQLDKYITFRVTPLTDTSVSGTPVSSSPIGPVVTNSVTVKIGAVSGNPGQNVVVPISIKETSTGIGSYGIKINFDSTALSVTSVTYGDGTDFVNYVVNEAGWLKAAWADSTGGDAPLQASTLFNISFKIKDEAEAGAKELTVDTNELLDFTFTDIEANEVDKTLEVGSVTVNERVATPTFTPESGTYTSIQQVAISTITSGATIYYTTDGSEPTTASTLYTGTITVSETQTIKAIAVKSDMANSVVASAIYTMEIPVAVPTFSPAEGSYTSVQRVSISTTTLGAAIYYTTDESTPTTESTLYVKDIVVNKSQTIKAIAVKSGMTSEVASAAYSITITYEPPVASPIKELITVDVEDSGGKQGGVVSSAIIERTTNPDGTIHDLVNFTTDQARETIASIVAVGSTSATMVIPDSKDDVAEVLVTVPKEANQLISDAKIDLGITTDNVKVMIPNSSLEGFTDDLYFHFIPIKDEKLKQEVKDRANNEAIVRVVAGDNEARIVGRPMTIETNMQNRDVTLVMPLLDVNLTQDELMDLGIYIEHSDGTKELIRGVLVPYNEKGDLGLQFTVNKFSTFTLVTIEGFGVTVQHLAYMKGFADGTFKPENSLTRAEMAAILARVITKEAKAADIAYSDVSSRHWAKDAISKVTTMGLMRGYANGTFAPDQPISRAEMASIVASLIERKQQAGVGFNDIVGHWAQASIMQLQAAGLINGYENGMFKPENPITRAETVVLINKLLDRVDETFADLEHSSWKDVPAGHWAIVDIEEASIDHALRQ